MSARVRVRVRIRVRVSARVRVSECEPYPSSHHVMYVLAVCRENRAEILEP